MYTRLWWKEARQFWPIWALLVVAAAAAQWMELKYFSPYARQGVLGAMALMWTGIYAVAVGAAAFAGERETGTLRLLDTLPAERSVVWAGKSSFALATTLAMAAVLVGLSALGTDRWSADPFNPEAVLTPERALFYGLIVLMALAWGLFWSSILGSALAAALSAVGALLFSPVFIFTTHALISRIILPTYKGELYYYIVLYETLLILAILVASNVLFTRTAQVWRLRFQLQSPIVIAPADPDRRRRTSVQIQSPAAAGPAVRLARADAVDQSPRRSRRAEALALAWETVREGATTWCLLAVVGLALPVPFYLGAGSLEPGWIGLAAAAAALVAGINVFGMENRGRTQRFLTHHGARPGLVWLVKLTVWCLGLAAIWGPQVIMSDAFRPYPVQPSPEVRLQFVLTIPLVFAVALLCGMAIPRAITAAVIALVMSLAVVVPQYLLIAARLLPALGLLAIPLALLVVSWAWSGDWLLDRPAPGRWLRLGTLLTGTFAVVFGLYVGFRAWSVPDIGPIAPPRAWIAAGSASSTADRNAAELYREAFRSMKGRHPNPSEPLDPYRETLDLARQAAAHPDYRVKRTEPLTLASPSPNAVDDGMIDVLARLVILDARNRLAHDDLAGSWNDLIAALRMVRHLSDGAAIGPAMNPLRIEREVLDLAMEWTIAPRQTSEQLRSALAAIRDLPNMTTADEILRAEANLAERTFDLPAKALTELLESIVNGPGQARAGNWPAPWLDWLTTPWERTRARRVNRLLATSAIQKATLEPARRPFLPQTSEADLQVYFSSTPLAKMLVANQDWLLAACDWNEVGRRALVQVLAIRDWQVRHNGQFPDSLDKLVPEELPSLPIDPYSGGSFAYVRSGGQALAPLGKVLDATGAVNPVATPGYWLLYSIGKDYRDDGAPSLKSDNREAQFRDIAFPIPPVSSGGGGEKKR